MHIRKRSLIVILVLFAIAISALAALQHYKLPLIHVIVVNAIIQKAPPDYPESDIQQVFQEVLLKAQQNEREDEYVTSMLRLSQRLEKIQELSDDEVDSLLDDYRLGLKDLGGKKRDRIRLLQNAEPMLPLGREMPALSG
jgi:hypothetical protein